MLCIGRKGSLCTAPLMLLCVVEYCFRVPKHVSVINYLIETKSLLCGREALKAFREMESHQRNKEKLSTVE